MRRGTGRAGPSALPVPRTSRGSSPSSLTHGRTSYAHSAEDLTRSEGISQLVQYNGTGSTPRRALSPGSSQQKSYSAKRSSQVAGSQTGVRYITEDLIRKCGKEESLEMIQTLNLTLAKEGGKKIKYIENLDKLRKLQVLNLSHNMIERMEKLDKLHQLRELNLSHNCISRVEGIESLTKLQVLSLTANRIEHIPAWLPKKLQALRTLRMADNQLVSLSELAKLKAIPDLIQLDMGGNPLADLPHCRLYIVFHLRCVEILDGQQVSTPERDKAQDRFALEEVQTLERQLEKGETKYRQLEESHNRSEQERSQQEQSQNESRLREREGQELLQQLQQELKAKDDLLKRKTADLNKACEKHYHLEQELAFYKIDSKFQTLGEAPPPPTDLSSDDVGLLGESPYLGRARFKANQRADEGQVHATPQRGQAHSLKGAGSVPHTAPLQIDMAQRAALDEELEKRKRELAATEDRLRSLQQDLSLTEQKLLNATQELKKLAPNRATPEPFRDDKFKIRQKLAKKMQTVNQMRDNATQIESEIDRIQQSVTQGRAELGKVKSEMQGLDSRSPAFQRKQRELQTWEQQVNQGHVAYDKMHNDLESTLNTITRETAEIKNLEEILTGQIEHNESLKSELDDIVSGLQSYLEVVKGQSLQHQSEFQTVQQEKEVLEEKVRRMEAELSILDTEAQHAKILQKQLDVAEKELNKTHSASQNLQDDLQQSRQRDMEIQDRLEDAENEVTRLNLSLAEVEKRAQAERGAIERQLQMERERLEKMTQKVQDANRQDLEAKKLLAQLEATKALNTSLRDQIDELQQKQQHEDDSGFKPSELKKRLRKFTHDFKTNKNPGEPTNKDDFLGTSFKEIYQAAQDKLNKSVREVDEVKKVKAKAEAEIQTMKEKLKEAQTQLQNLDNKKADEEKKKMQDEITRLQANLKQLKEGGIPVRIVYAPSDGSGDRTSSLDSEEKLLFDELQRELMELKRHMRQQDHEASRKVTEAETEAAHWQDELRAQQQQFEGELEKHRLEAELLREKQEARIQVIAADLDQAQYSADALQNALNQRETVLQQELSAADMSNQMMSVQEEELARLYDILEAQRGEIENLNQMLDYLATQGPDGVGPGFDDELWRIRQEVNKLKETLAMQSAYVQAMPSSQAMGTQAGLAEPIFSSTGVGGDAMMGDRPFATRRASSAAGVGVGGGSQPASLPTSRYGFSTGVQLRSSAPPSIVPGPSSAAQQRQIAGAGPSATHLSRSGQSSGLADDPRTNYGNLGNERRESKVPTGGRFSVGKKGPVTPGQQNSRNSRKESSGDRANRPSGDHHRRAASVPSAFEMVHPRSDGFTPLSSSSPSRASVARGLGLQGSIPGNDGFGIQPPQAMSHGVKVAGVDWPGQGIGPSLGIQASGVQGASRRSQTQGASRRSQTSEGFNTINQVGTGQKSAVVPMPIPVYAAPLPLPHPGAFQPEMAGPVPQPWAMVYPGTHDVGTGYTGGPQVAFGPIATQYTYSDLGGGGGGIPGGHYEVPTAGRGIPGGYVPYQAPIIGGGIPGGYEAPSAGGGIPGGYVPYAAPDARGRIPAGNVPYEAPTAPSSSGLYNYGSQAYIPSGPAQQLTYQPARAFIPASSDNARNARIYYPTGAPIPMPAPGAPPPPHLHQPVTMMGQASPMLYPMPVTPMASGMPVTPIASGTPVRGGGHAIPVNLDGTFAVYPPSPIRTSGMESPTRGILKNGNASVTGVDESYLFCNVPEHHDSEDYISELQDTLKRLKGKCVQEKSIKESLVADNDKKVIKRLLNDLEVIEVVDEDDGGDGG